jgi:hypothetical protein
MSSKNENVSILLVAAVFYLAGAFSAEAINLKPENPHDFKGNLNVSSEGKHQKIEDVRVMVSKKEINIIPGHKSGLPDRHIKAQKHDQYSDDKGHPVTVQILDETKGLTFTFQNGDVCTFHKHDD